MIMKNYLLYIAGVHVPVPKDFNVKFSSIRVSFGKMLYRVRKILRKECEVEDIKEFLSCNSTSLRKKVDNCDSMSSILRLIQDECSLTNIELLCSVVEEMKATEAEECLQTYKTELKEFCKLISVELCLKKRFDSVSHLQCEMATFVFDWEPEEHMLVDIKDILSKVSGKLMKIKYIEPSNSIMVTCSFPHSYLGFAVLAMIDSLHVLLQQGLKKLTVGNLTLWRRGDVRQKVNIKNLMVYFNLHCKGTTREGSSLHS